VYHFGVGCTSTLAATAVAFTAVGCTLDFDAVGPRGGASLATGGDAAGGAGSCDGTCFALGSFEGLYSLDVPACGAPTLRGGYADGAEPFFDAPAATCGCSCEQPEDLGCSNQLVAFFDVVDCDISGAQGSVQIAEDQCASVNAIDGYGFSPPTDGGVITVACQSDREPANEPPVTFTAPLAACNAALPSCGESSVCLPNEPRALCLLSEHEEMCPQGFDVRRSILLAEEMADDRTCVCACDTTTTACIPQFAVFSDAACQDAITDAGATCIHASDNTKLGAVRYDPVLPPDACLNITELPSGSVAPGQKRFLCCSDQP